MPKGTIYLIALLIVAVGAWGFVSWWDPPETPRPSDQRAGGSVAHIDKGRPTAAERRSGATRRKAPSLRRRSILPEDRYEEGELVQGKLVH